MNATSTRVIPVHEGEWLDMAARIRIPVGASVLPPKVYQPSGFLITTADRAVMDAEAAVGTDVLEDTVLITIPVRAGLRSYETTDVDLESALRASIGETAIVLVPVLCFLLGGLPPLIGHGRPFPPALQIAGACLPAILLVSAALRSARQRLTMREVVRALIAPLTGGVAGAFLAPVSSPDSRLLVTLFAMWGTGAAALLFWIIRRGASEAVSTGVWLFLSVAGMTVPVMGISRVPVLVVPTAAGAVGGLLIPCFAM